MSDGLCVIGRDDRMGLGSMTSDFCQGMRPDRLVLVDVGSRKGKIEIPRGSYGEMTRVLRGRMPGSALTSLFHDMQVVVGFETWYFPQLPVIARSIGVKSVLFPMWEWSSDADCGNSDTLLCLSETDYRKYWTLGSKAINCGWPVSSEIHDPKQAVNWPPKTFVHIAGNASHNRDGTREVLAASKHLAGSDAKLIIYSNFILTPIFSYLRGPHIEIRPATVTRKELFAGCDCLVQPRRLGGHSLPINEAWGEGIPCITLDLPDWKGNPYTVTPQPQPDEQFGLGLCQVGRADSDALGRLMRDMADGKIERKESPRMPTWDSFRQTWQEIVG